MPHFVPASPDTTLKERCLGKRAVLNTMTQILEEF